MCYLVSTFCGKTASNEIADALSVPLSGEALSATRTQSHREPCSVPPSLMTLLRRKFYSAPTGKCLWCGQRLHSLFSVFSFVVNSHTKGFTNLLLTADSNEHALIKNANVITVIYSRL